MSITNDKPVLNDQLNVAAACNYTIISKNVIVIYYIKHTFYHLKYYL